jgi:hypothetical protein
LILNYIQNDFLKSIMNVDVDNISECEDSYCSERKIVVMKEFRPSVQSHMNISINSGDRYNRLKAENQTDCAHCCAVL